jgi:hypothetical protein
VAGIDTPTLAHVDAAPASVDGGVDDPNPTLRVAMRGNALGHVTSTPDGIDCPGKCTATFARGTVVRLAADPRLEDIPRDLRFAGWDASDCGDASGPCDVHLNAPTTVGARFFSRVNVAFVSSSVTDGAMGGLGGANTRCEQLAADAGLPAGHYVAWLSGAGVAAAVDRLGTASGWVRVDGKPFAATRADLLGGRILYPLRLDEHGRDVVDSEPEPIVFTGTERDGQPSGADCSTWSEGNCGFDCLRPASVGSPAGGTDAWTHANLVADCGRMGHIYCLGVDSAVAAPRPPEPTDQQSLLWISSVPYQPGVGDIHDLCLHDASAFGIEGGEPRPIFAFQNSTAAASWLVTQIGHLPPTHFVRPDGVVPVDSLTDLVDGHGFRAPLNVGPGPTYLGTDARVWLGTADMDQPANDSVCDFMTSGLSSTLTIDPTLATMQSQPTPCTGLAFVWCVQYREEIP